MGSQMSGRGTSVPPSLAERGLSPAPAKARPPTRIVWMVGASLLVAAGLASVYAAKTQNFADVSDKLRHGDLLNLNAVSSAEQLEPFLEVIQDATERDVDAEK